jgi:nicotinamidase-related amidase
MDPLSLHPETTALLLVDVQERLLPAMPEFEGRRLLSGIELLTETARLLHLPILVTEQYPRGLGHTVESVRTLLEQAEPRPLVVEKTVFSALDPHEITRALAARGVRSVITVGMEAHVCVFQTARELQRRGYRAHVPFDAVASRDPACKQTALALLGGNGVSVTTTETIVFDLLRDAGHPHFKALSARIKALPMPPR